MSVIRLERTGSDHSVFQTMDAHCESCAGCGLKNRSIELPHIQGNLAQLEMSMSDQWRILLNSWLKPLLLVMIVSIISSSLALSLLFEISLTVVAFLVGFALCREISPAVLSINGKSLGAPLSKGSNRKN